MTYKPSILGQTDLVFGLWEEQSWSKFTSSMGLCMQDYKSLRVACIYVQQANAG